MAVISFSPLCIPLNCSMSTTLHKEMETLLFLEERGWIQVCRYKFLHWTMRFVKYSITRTDKLMIFLSGRICLVFIRFESFVCAGQNNVSLIILLTIGRNGGESRCYNFQYLHENNFNYEFHCG